MKINYQTLWIEKDHKEKNKERAKRLLPRYSMEELISFGKRADEMKSGWAEEMLKELCHRIENE